MSSILNYLPPADGLLPKWLLFVNLPLPLPTKCPPSQPLTVSTHQISVVSMANSIQSYTTLSATQKVYLGSLPPTSSQSKSQPNPSANSPVTGLSARTFGTWTAITAVVRLYAAYHIEQQAMYELALWTFGVAWAHFMSEWWIFRTARWGAGLAGPVAVSTSSLIWMWLQWDYYVKN